MGKLYFVLVISLQLVLTACQAQTPGCTDPLANNYDPSASRNDGSCTYETLVVSPATSTPLNSTLHETSGLILWDDYVWTHNDNGDTLLYGLDTLTAEVMDEHPLQGVENIDWEEISQDEQYIYVGDFGNNGSGNRTDLHILRVDKSSLKAGNARIDTIWFSYEDQTDFSPQASNMTEFDCEAMIVSEDSIYLFTKQWISANTTIYSLPKEPGTYEAKNKASQDVMGLVTGATYLESKQLVVLTAYNSALIPYFYLLYDFSGKEFFDGNKRSVLIALPIHQIEGIATENGLKYYVSNEYSELEPFPTQVQKLHTFDLSSLLKGYLSGLTSVESLSTGRGSYKIYPNPAGNEVVIKTKDLQTSTSFVVYDLSARPVLSGELTGPKTRVDIRLLNSGIYIIRIADQNDTSLKITKQ
jgi:hypothetical protein